MLDNSHFSCKESNSPARHALAPLSDMLDLHLNASPMSSSPAAASVASHRTQRVSLAQSPLSTKQDDWGGMGFGVIASRINAAANSESMDKTSSGFPSAPK